MLTIANIERVRPRYGYRCGQYACREPLWEVADRRTFYRELVGQQVQWQFYLSGRVYQTWCCTIEQAPLATSHLEGRERHR